ncbi:Na/Pi cotransporter family protein [Bacteroidota bacterium]
MIKKISFAGFIIILAFGLFFYPTLNEIGVGVAILLFGIISLENGFKSITEGPVKNTIRRRTKTTAGSLTVGAVSTAFMQSSSLVSVLVISFISAGLITLKSGIGVIFGANIGTTFTGWLVALFGLNFKISAFAMPLIIFGVLFVLQKARSVKALGYVLVGIGFLFLGVSYIKTGFEILQSQVQLVAPFSSDISNMLFFTALGIAATIIMQSSAASLAIIITALSINQITYEQSLALAIGSNIGTTFTAVLGALAADAAGKRIAGAHLIFNIITGAVALILLKPLAVFVAIITGGLGIAADNYTLQLAMFHTVFNILGVAIMVPWINSLIVFLNKVIKEKKPDVIQPRYLNEAVLKHPESAISAIYKETEHMLDLALAIIARGVSISREDIAQVKKVSDILLKSKTVVQVSIEEEYTRKIKTLYSKIIKYITQVQSQELSPGQQDIISNLKNANMLIVEVLKDLAELRSNLNEFINSDNKDLVEVYNYFRKRIIQVAKGLFGDSVNYPYHGENPEDISKINFDILKQRKRIERIKDEVNVLLSEMILKKNTSSTIASSVLNDSQYVFRICNNLLKVIELLYYEESDYILEQETVTY